MTLMIPIFPANGSDVAGACRWPAAAAAAGAPDFLAPATAEGLIEIILFATSSRVGLLCCFLKVHGRSIHLDRSDINGSTDIV